MSVQNCETMTSKGNSELSNVDRCFPRLIYLMSLLCTHYFIINHVMTGMPFPSLSDCLNLRTSPVTSGTSLNGKRICCNVIFQLKEKFE